MEITLKYVHARRIGYGRLGVDLARGMAKAGVTVYDGIEGDPGESVEGVVAGRTESVLWVSVPAHALHWLEGQRVSMFTMWEATILPEQMRENIKEFDTVIVPSVQNQELFGVYHDNVQYCPLAVDLEQWHYTPRQEPGAFFNFLTAGSGGRKNPEMSLDAFKKAFPMGSTGTGPIPRLIHKSPRGAEIFGPDVETLSGYISDEDEIALYERAHCYLAPSRGEGFGLQPLQAMAQGCPTILTDAHGHKAFSHLGYPVGATLVKAGEFMMGDAGDWWEPNIDEMVDHMRWVYNNYDAACENAAWNSTLVAEQFSQEQMTNRVLDLVGRDKLNPYTGSGDWYRPDPRLYQVVTNRDWKAEIAEKIIMCEKGEVYWLSADSKRVLYDAGVLDPSCIESEINRGKPHAAWVDTGITEQQWKHYLQTRDNQKACMHCGQIIGSGIQASDQIFARLEREAAMR